MNCMEQRVSETTATIEILFKVQIRPICGLNLSFLTGRYSLSKLFRDCANKVQFFVKIWENKAQLVFFELTVLNGG